MGSGNPLLKRLARDSGRTPAPAPAARAWGAEPSPAVQATDRALLLVALTLVSGVLAWWFLSSAPSDSWQVENSDVIGFVGFSVAIGIMLVSWLRPLVNPAPACLLALAQGVLFACTASAFEVAIPGLFANVLLGSVLVALSALAYRRTALANAAAGLSIAAASATGLTALGLVKAVAGREPFASSMPWFVLLVTVVVGVITAYSLHVDLRLVDAFAASDGAGRRVWAAALGLSAGLTGMYVWRFFNLRDRDSRSSSDFDTGSDWDSGSDSGSDSGGSSSD
jgi:hypothetical protein